MLFKRFTSYDTGPCPSAAACWVTGAGKLAYD
jgi:hypothetical protein